MSDAKKSKRGQRDSKQFELSAQTQIGDEEAQRIEDEKETGARDADTDDSEESVQE